LISPSFHSPAIRNPVKLRVCHAVVGKVLRPHDPRLELKPRFVANGVIDVQDSAPVVQVHARQRDRQTLSRGMMSHDGKDRQLSGSRESGHSDRTLLRRLFLFISQGDIDMTGALKRLHRDGPGFDQHYLASEPVDRHAGRDRKFPLAAALHP
jgi:hypothetical protein